MSDLVRWSVSTLVLAGILMLGFLWRLPSFVVGLYLRGFGRRIGGEPWNKAQWSGPPKAGGDVVPFSSPDIAIVFGAFNVSREPVRVRCLVPDGDSYWSLSLFTLNNDHIYVVNDLAIKNQALELVIVGPKGAYRRQQNELTFTSPVAKGILLIRAVVKNPDDQDEVARVGARLRQTTIEPVSQAAAQGLP